MMRAADCGAQPREQRFDVRAEQPGLEVAQQLLHGEQRIDLLRTEPQAGKLLHPRARIVAITACLAIPNDRDVESRAQILQVALERRGGDLQLVKKSARRNDLVPGDQLLNSVEAFGTVHPTILNALSD